MNIPWCEVCHGAPKGAQYGALACLGCIVFFRRAIVGENIKRKCNLNCDILFEKKNCCRSCRLQKCLKVGMDPNAVQHRDLIGPRKPIKLILKKKADAISGSCEIDFDYLMELQRKQTIKWERYGRQNENIKKVTATDIRFVMSLGFQNATVWANHFEPFWSLSNDEKTSVLSEYGIAFILMEQAIKTVNEGIKGVWLLQTGTSLLSPVPCETEQEKIHQKFVNELLEMLWAPFKNLGLDKFETIILKTLLLLTPSHQKNVHLTGSKLLREKCLSELMKYTTNISPSSGLEKFGEILLLMGSIRCAVKLFFNHTKKLDIFQMDNFDAFTRKYILM
ncbi:Nuclear Hormone Receptor family [Caenorhabditis elegans]|uniref:Nuclear Hormone Receptor family n=1 Tax=Caenorhabditis elegans TaxID=6239 RepID=O17991_CAEEL|nr:Nuclear Hormone Receptor family [Caenorhabditis elegans]CAB04634.3 Nuclear Hormone Receptor family [Caenorhabditis elegans]|eukprot:NP_001343586.1 Nuclear Hormone Receptor family [Caenorhabditis elegans]